MARKTKIDLTMLQEMPPWEWPDGTAKVLLEILRDSKSPAGDRLIAAELGGDTTIVDDKLADALLAIVGDDRSADEIRAQAAISLGPALEHSDLMGFEDPEDRTISEKMFEKIQETLHKLFLNEETPVLVRRRILEAAVRAQDDWQVDAIHAAFPQRKDGWRLTAVFCMRFVRGFEAQVLEALKDRDPEIVCEALLAAGTWEIEAAWPKIKSIIESPRRDKPLLVAAIEAVGAMRPEEAPELLAHLEDDEDQDIADAVAEALDNAEMGDLGNDGDWDEEDGDEDDEDDDEDDEDDDEDEGNGGDKDKVLN